MKYNNAIELIGGTPILKVNKLVEENNAEVFVKLEKFNASGSVKDRAALGMIERAKKDGALKDGQTIIEPTSGNTGIAIALIGSLMGHEVIIVMPDTMSKERREVIKAYGAKLILTEGSKGMKGAIEKANELAVENNYFLPQQFENIGNPAKHYETTASEILEDIPDVDIIVAGVGTGGTITGIAENIKGKNKNIKIIAVEPKDSPVLSGGKPGPHKIQGIGAGFIPSIYKGDLVDGVIQVTNEEAFETAKNYTKKEGILVGISSGAAIFAGLKLAKEIGADKKIVVIAPDGGEKYFSVGLYE